MKIILLLLIIFFNSIILFADTSFVQLKEYITTGLKNNPEISRLKNEVSAANAAVDAAGYLMEPKLSAGYNVSEISVKNYKLTFEQELPLSNKLALEKRMRKSNVAETVEMLRLAQLKVKREIKTAYLDLYFLNKRIQAANTTLSLVENMRNVISARYKTNTAEIMDAVKLNMEIDKLKIELANLQLLFKPYTIKFYALLNSKPVKINLPSDISLNFFEFDNSALIKVFSENNPELKMLNQKITSATIAENLAKREYIPDLMIGVEYEKMAETSGAMGSSASSKDPVMLMAGIKLPVWRKKLKALVNEKKYMRASAAVELSNAENIMTAELQMILSNITVMRRNVGLYENSLIPQTRKLNEIIKNNYITGKADFNELLENIKMTVELELMKEQMYIEYLKMLAMLEEMTDTNLF